MQTAVNYQGGLHNQYLQEFHKMNVMLLFSIIITDLLVDQGFLLANYLILFVISIWLTYFSRAGNLFFLISMIKKMGPKLMDSIFLQIEIVILKVSL